MVPASATAILPCAHLTLLFSHMRLLIIPKMLHAFSVVILCSCYFFHLGCLSLVLMFIFLILQTQFKYLHLPEAFYLIITEKLFRTSIMALLTETFLSLLPHPTQWCTCTYLTLDSGRGGSPYLQCLPISMMEIFPLWSISSYQSDVTH